MPLLSGGTWKLLQLCHNIFDSECTISAWQKYADEVTVHHSLNIQIKFDAYKIAKGSVVHTVLRDFNFIVERRQLNKMLFASLVSPRRFLMLLNHIKHPCLWYLVSKM